MSTRDDTQADEVARPVIHDASHGYEAIAATFIACRSQIGAAEVRAWAAALPDGSSVLDLGCGSGVPITAALLDAGCRVAGVDASPAMVAAFRARHPDLDVVCEPAESSSCFGRSYDAVVAWGLLFLLAPEAQARLIATMARALVPDGAFLFTAPAQACTWADALTGQSSISLGATEYRRLCALGGLQVRREFDDEGGNHYFVGVGRSRLG